MAKKHNLNIEKKSAILYGFFSAFFLLALRVIMFGDMDTDILKMLKSMLAATIFLFASFYILKRVVKINQ